ncbi:hypothetical protein Abr02nite_51820 [Paractinoplanes brasiliensis]|nr:hypothetical protein Abr02nite_51820 [Actinoplanes brasiliensis]
MCSDGYQIAYSLILKLAELSGKLAAGSAAVAPPPRCRQTTAQSPRGEPGNQVSGVHPRKR